MQKAKSPCELATFNKTSLCDPFCVKLPVISVLRPCKKVKISAVVRSLVFAIQQFPVPLPSLSNQCPKFFFIAYAPCSFRLLCVCVSSSLSNKIHFHTCRLFINSIFGDSAMNLHVYKARATHYAKSPAIIILTFL